MTDRSRMTAPWVHVATLRGLAKRRGVDEISAHALTEAANVIEEYGAEIGRLRAAVRVNALRHGATDAEINAVIFPAPTSPTGGGPIHG
jgi:hypothetical protein